MKNNSLTKKRKKLLDLFLETSTEAKVLRRHQNEDGTYRFEDVVRPTKPIDFPAHQGEFALKIHQSKPDAPLSPIYVNLRNLPDHILDQIAHVLAEVKFDEKYDYCTGIPKTAVSMAKKFSEISGIPFIDVFEKVGPDTNRKIVIKDEAKNGKGKNLLIIDDVVSQAKSKYEAIQAAESLGYKVGILVLVDREQGGLKQLNEDGYPTYGAVKLREITNYYLEIGKITKKQHKKVEEYLSAS